MAYIFFQALTFPTMKRKPTARELFISPPFADVTLKMWLAAEADRYSWIDDRVLFEKLRRVTGTFYPSNSEFILRAQDLRTAFSVFTYSIIFFLFLLLL